MYIAKFGKIDTRCGKFVFIWFDVWKVISDHPFIHSREGFSFNSGIKPQTNPIINMGSVSLCTIGDHDFFSMQRT
jgi:hypothetical protein